MQELRLKSFPFVKVLWRNFSCEEATWELEERMKKLYPSLFGEYSNPIFEDEDYLKGERM